jgi:hypothetical protein
MFWSSPSFRVLAGLASIVMLPLTARAGVDPAAGGSGARGLGEIESIDARAMQGQQRNNHRLRCWQEGFLIIEREIGELPIEAERAVRVDADGGHALRLYDLRNSTCMID